LYLGALLSLARRRAARLGNQDLVLTRGNRQGGDMEWNGSHLG
jgi:hypothetical protein